MQLTPTAQQSLNLVRNLLSTALGAVVYIRGLFPENHFKDSSLGGIALKSIERNVSPQSDELLNWLEHGCYDALEKRYLKTMIFGIYLDPEEPEKLVEAYTFGFSYPNKDQWCLTIDANGKESHRLRTRGAVMKATSDMLRRLLILTETLRPLPENACLTMKLFYYDDITPEDYEPPYFREGDNDSKFYFASPPERVKTGMVETPYHALNMHVQAATEELEMLQDDADAEELIDERHEPNHDARATSDRAAKVTTTGSNNQVTDVINQLGQMDLEKRGYSQGSAAEDTLVIDTGNRKARDQSTLSNDQEIPDTQDTQQLFKCLEDGITPRNQKDQHQEPHRGRSTRAAQKQQQNHPRAKLATVASKDVQSVPKYADRGNTQTEGRYGVKPQASSDGDYIECPCGVNLDDGEMIYCALCDVWGHMACAGYREGGDPRMPKDYVCYACRNNATADQPPYDLEHVAEVALLRRGIFVAFTSGLTKITLFADHMGVPLPQAKQILQRLKKENFVEEKQPQKNKRKSGPIYQVLKDTPAAKAAYAKWYSEAPFTEAAAKRGLALSTTANEPDTMDVDSSRDPPINPNDFPLTPAASPQATRGTAARSVSHSTIASSVELIDATPVAQIRSGGDLPRQGPIPLTRAAATDETVYDGTDSVKQQFLQQFSDRQMTGFEGGDDPEVAGTTSHYFASAAHKRAAPADATNQPPAKKRKVSVVKQPLMLS
ncbi:HORMA domain-containing protein 1 [Geranomyces variabilis]|uniref:HORMA domain-containing protein 1 n=1 Tax=Geranomyces variabilis TaxID=109894 RepID=A0AAD5TGI6_9FUNG|nr:HORMA domain-containing protein 1 [Geranomyces variabilis]